MKSTSFALILYFARVLCQNSPVLEAKDLGRSCTRNDNRTGRVKLITNCTTITPESKDIVGIDLRFRSNVVCCPYRVVPTRFPPGGKAKKYCREKASVAPLFLVDKLSDFRKSEVYEFPHMVALGYNYQNSIEYECGGSLVTESFVVTTACCLDRIDNPVTTVRIGRVCD